MSGQRNWLRLAAEGRASSPAPFLHWCEVCQVAAELTNPQGRELDRSRAPGDLPRRLDEAIEAVHRSEQAQLLVEASALRVKVTEKSGTGLAPLVLGVGVGGRDVGGVDARRSRTDQLTRLGEELHLARADEVDVPLELVACSLWPPRLWGRGSGEALARAALSLDPSPEVQLALVRALVARGRPGAALLELEQLAVLRARDPVAERPGFGRAVDLARAAAFERRGDLSATLVGLDRVGEAGWPVGLPLPTEDAGGADETSGDGRLDGQSSDLRISEERGDRLLLESLTLALALLLGDSGVAERALLRTRMPGLERGAGWENSLRRAVARWRAALRGGQAPRVSSGLPDASAGVVFRMLASHDPVLTRVAFLVIGR